MSVELTPCANCHSRFVVVQKMGRGIRFIHAIGEQKVRSAQIRAERAHGNLLGRFVQSAAVHLPALRVRSLDTELGSVAVPSQ